MSIESRSRISGSEMEWPLLVKSRGGDYEQPGTVSAKRYLKYCLDPRLAITETYGMLSNGARFYVDIGDHPEYATPEDDSFMGTVANEIAGERVMNHVMELAKQRSMVDDYILTKRVVDDKLNTWGYHFSLNSETLTDIDAETLRPLGMHLATVNILLGAGAVLPAMRNNYTFAIAQKAQNLNMDYSSTSHGSNNPLISLRNEPLGGPDTGRVHITSLDANMSPWATWMKLCTTSIVLRLMEHGELDDIVYPNAEMHVVARIVACDSSLIQRFTMRDGSKKGAIDIQLDLIERAKLYMKNEGLPDEEAHALDEWERVLNDMMSSPELTMDRVEWVARKVLLRKYMGRHGLSLADERVRHFDKCWSYIGQNGLAERLRTTLWKEWMPSESSIEHAVTEPPCTTRAFARAALIKSHQDPINETVHANWDHVDILSSNGTLRYRLDDPYDPVIRQAERLQKSEHIR